MQSQRAAFLPVNGWCVFSAGVLVFGFALAISAGAASGPGPGGPLALAESERVFLANIEQRGLVLTRRGWPALAAAIRAGEAAKVAQFFSTNFQGATLAVGEGKGVDLPTLKVRRQTNPGAACDAGTFARFLTELRQRFAPDAKVELALMSLLPVKREDLDGAWGGSCAFRLVGPRTAGGHGELMAKLDFELNSVPDADEIATRGGWIRSLRAVEAQEAVATHELFREVGREWGINRALFQDNWQVPVEQRPIVTGGVFLADVDNDGHQDVLITDERGLFLYRGGPGGRFEEVTHKSGLSPTLRRVLNAAWADFDGDGLVDLITATRVFRNLGGFRFEDISDRARIPMGSGVSGFSIGDYDRDGKVDLYVSRNDSVGKFTGTNSWIDGPGGPGNQLWRNLGDWKFEEVSSRANAQAGRRSVFTSAWLDANNDNWPDIYCINEFGGGVLLVNKGDGTFREMPLVDDTGDFGSMGLAVGDYDNDGNIDVYTANMYSKAGRRIMENLSDGTFAPEVFAKMKRFVTGSELYHNDGGLKFTRAGKRARVHAVGWAYGAAFFDLDNDGFLDLYGTAGFVSVNKEEPDG
ncbi:MAG TPA: VCBS repeat-containing protein [Verrucomicrobiae bacterium]|nr:VCBS repeat-containing protein [Verrucomicrobiae bacterium]